MNDFVCVAADNCSRLDYACIISTLALFISTLALFIKYRPEKAKFKLSMLDFDINGYNHLKLKQLKRLGLFNKNLDAENIQIRVRILNPCNEEGKFIRFNIPLILNIPYCEYENHNRHYYNDMCRSTPGSSVIRNFINNNLKQSRLDTSITPIANGKENIITKIKHNMKIKIGVSASNYPLQWSDEITIKNNDNIIICYINGKLIKEKQMIDLRSNN